MKYLLSDYTLATPRPNIERILNLYSFSFFVYFAVVLFLIVIALSYKNVDFLGPPFIFDSYLHDQQLLIGCYSIFGNCKIDPLDPNSILLAAYNPFWQIGSLGVLLANSILFFIFLTLVLSRANTKSGPLLFFGSVFFGFTSLSIHREGLLILLVLLIVQRLQNRKILSLSVCSLAIMLIFLIRPGFSLIVLALWLSTLFRSRFVGVFFSVAPIALILNDDVIQQNIARITQIAMVNPGSSAELFLLWLQTDPTMISAIGSYTFIMNLIGPIFRSFPFSSCGFDITGLSFVFLATINCVALVYFVKTRQCLQNVEKYLLGLLTLSFIVLYPGFRYAAPLAPFLLYNSSIPIYKLYRWTLSIVVVALIFSLIQVFGGSTVHSGKCERPIPSYFFKN